MFPIVLLSVFGIALLFLGFLKSKAILLPATLLFLLITLAVNFLDWNKTYLYFNDMLRTNNLAMVFTAIILVSAFLVVALSGSFIESEESQPAEYYAIILFSLVGAIMMVSFENLIMLFVGVEILSVAMYVLTGSDKRNLRSNEAALKYFLMGAFTTGIMLFGMALLYGATGSFTIAGIGAYAAHPQGPFVITLCGLVDAAHWLALQSIGRSFPFLDARRLRWSTNHFHRLYVYRGENGWFCRPIPPVIGFVCRRVRISGGLFWP